MSTKHACMLDDVPNQPSISPLSNPWRRIKHGGTCFLPCAWHYSSKCFLSEKGLQTERVRQLNSGHGLWIHPYSPFKFYWDLFIMLAYLYSLIYLPFQVFFHCPRPDDASILFCDAMNVLDIIIRFRTGIVDDSGKNANMNWKYIAIKYFKDTFVLDVLSAAPLQFIPLGRKFERRCKFPTHTVFYVFKFSRIIICGRVWNHLAKQFNVSYLWAKMVITIARSAIFFHWMVYVHIQVPEYLAHFYPHQGRFHEWMLRFKVYGEKREVVWWFEKYVVNLYLVTGLCIGAGFYSVKNRKAQHWPEQLLTAILSLVGLACSSYFMITILRMILYINYGTFRYNGLLMELHNLLKFKRVPQRLRHKIHLYLNYRFNGNYFNKDLILATLNVQIKQEINMYYCKNLLINVPLFQDMPIALINTIIFSLTQVLYMPGEVIVQYGHPGSSLYLIASGTVAIMDSNGMEVGHMTDGAFFGETTVVNPGLPRAATIIALEITEIYKLNHAQLRAALQPFPRLKRRLFNLSDRNLSSITSDQ